jgi:hypothetical protein
MENPRRERLMEEPSSEPSENTGTIHAEEKKLKQAGCLRVVRRD